MSSPEPLAWGQDPARGSIGELDSPPASRSSEQATTCLRHPVLNLALSLQVFALCVTLPLYLVYGLSFDLASLAHHSVFPLVLVAIWLYHRYFDAGRDAPYLAEVLLLALLLVTLTNVTSPAQYLAIAMRPPLVDPWLASADASLGVHVPALAAWTASYPVVSMALTACYYSLLPQLFMPVVMLGLILKDLGRLYEYVFHFHFCLVVTVIAVAFFPAEGTATFYDFEPTISQSRFMRQFAGFREGTLTVIRFDDLEGMISVPSFHTAGALMCTWVFRHYRYLWPPLAVINIGLIAATFMSGAHYVIDILVTFVLFGVSVRLYHAWDRTPREPGGFGRPGLAVSPPPTAMVRAEAHQTGSVAHSNRS